MGIEAYGIVGFYTTISILLTVLDFGLSTTLNREIAKNHHSQNAQEIRDLTRTLEIVYWIIAVCVGIFLFILISYFSKDWSYKISFLSKFYMGIAVCFQMPFALYSGGLIGLKQQVLLNTIITISSTFRWAGAFAILYFISPTITLFFIWQIIINFSQTIITAIFLWRHLPCRTQFAKFNKLSLIKVKNFATGITIITILSIILTQTDKIILAKLLPLETFGYYSLATMIANSINFFSAPICTTFFPRFTNLHFDKTEEPLKNTYHIGCQLMTVIVLPVAALLIFFSPEIVYLWTHNAITITKTSSIISLLTIGYLFNVFVQLPYFLQLSYGWTKLAVCQNIFGIILLIPLLLIGIHILGVIGAAIIWIMLNLGYILITIPIMHKKLLTSEKKAWYFKDVLLPCLGILPILIISRYFFPKNPISDIIVILYLIGVFLISLLTTILLCPHAYRWLIEEIRKWLPKHFLKNIDQKNVP